MSCRSPKTRKAVREASGESRWENPHKGCPSTRMRNCWCSQTISICQSERRGSGLSEAKTCKVLLNSHPEQNVEGKTHSKTCCCKTMTFVFQCCNLVYILLKTHKCCGFKSWVHLGEIKHIYLVLYSSFSLAITYILSQLNSSWSSTSSFSSDPDGSRH